MNFKETISAIITTYNNDPNRNILLTNLTILNKNLKAFNIEDPKIGSYLSSFMGHCMTCTEDVIKTWFARLSDINITTNDINIKFTSNSPASLEIKIIPKKLLVGDVILLMTGPVKHYCIVLAITKNIVYCSSITSKDELSGFPIVKSRLFRGQILYTVYQTSLNTALSNFIGIYDSKVEFKEYCKQLKKKLQKLRIS